LGNYLKSGQIEYKTMGRDGFGRILGNIYVDNVDLSNKMVRSGMARAYDASEVHDEIKPDKVYFDELMKLQIMAKQEKTGIWSDDCLGLKKPE